MTKLEKGLGRDYPQIPQIMLMLADMHRRQGLFREAESEAREALQIIRRQKKTGQPDALDQAPLMGALAGLNLILLRGGKSAAARFSLAEMLDQFSCLRNNPGLRYYDTEGPVGECLTLLRRFAEAEPILLKEYQQISAIRGPRSPFTTDARRRLVELYEAWGKPEQAALYRPQS